MKIKFLQFVLLYILLFNNTIAGYTQNWAPIGAEWYYSVSDGGNPLYDCEHYTSTKDTLVAGKVCSLIKSQHHTEIMFEEGNRVYYWFKNKFRLLYDYSIQQGDTVEFEFKSHSRYSLVIDTVYPVKCVFQNVDSFEVGTINLKTYTVTILENDSLDFLVWDAAYDYTEKLGWYYNFMFELSPPSVGFTNYERCYSDNTINYRTSFWDQFAENLPCDYATNSGLIENKVSEIKLLKLSESLLQVTINDPKYLENYVAMIFDNNGKIHLKVPIENQLQMISIYQLPKGMYTIVIYGNEKYINNLKFSKL